jgi:biopolymer transport protein ExbD
MALSGRPSAEQDHFDLLPFVGIMMCLLGTLLLVTMSVAVINIGAGAGEGWVPQLDKDSKIPVLVEWDGKYAVWHAGNDIRTIEENFIEYTPVNGTWVRYDPDGRGHPVNGPQPNPLDPLVNYLQSHESTHYALFAVRPSGFKNFRRFASRFEDRQIEIGSEPLDQGKSVRLVMPVEGKK